MYMSMYMYTYMFQTFQWKLLRSTAFSQLAQMPKHLVICTNAQAVYMYMHVCACLQLNTSLLESSQNHVVNSIDAHQMAMCVCVCVCVYV